MCGVRCGMYESRRRRRLPQPSTKAEVAAHVRGFGAAYEDAARLIDRDGIDGELNSAVFLNAGAGGPGMPAPFAAAIAGVAAPA